MCIGIARVVLTRNRQGIGRTRLAGGTGTVACWCTLPIGRNPRIGGSCDLTPVALLLLRVEYVSLTMSKCLARNKDESSNAFVSLHRSE